MRYCVIFVFTRKDGSIWTDEEGNEEYHAVYVEAKNEKDAEKKFWKQESFKGDKPTIYDIYKMEEQK